METTSKKAPVGTQRYWESTGQTWIKTHDNTYFDERASPWMVVPTISQTFTTLFHALDEKGRKIISYKEPIDGDLWLSKEFEDFETKSGKRFSTADFKQYAAFDKRAAKYSFTSELTKRLMSQKIKLNADIAENLIDLNDRVKTQKLRAGENVGDKKIVLTDEEVKASREATRADFKEDDSQKLTLEDVHEIDKVLQKVLSYLEQGETFEGDQKTAYEKAKEILTNIQRGPYYPLSSIRDSIREAYRLINGNFADNWGIRESFRLKMDNAFTDYVSKYRTQIERDELEAFKTQLGVDLYEETNVFYNAVKKSNFFSPVSIGDFEGKEIPDPSDKYSDVTLVKYNYHHEKATFRDQVGNETERYVQPERLQAAIRQRLFNLPDIDVPLKLRLSGMFTKDLSGTFDIHDLTLLETFEKIAEYLPEGHVSSNDSFRKLRKQTDLGGKSDNSYAHYAPVSREIYLSSDVLKHSEIGLVDLHSGQEVASTLIHEIGHAVSAKLGGRNSKEYRKFVVECGWSWEQFQYGDKVNNYQATGGDADIKRYGSRSDRKLITDYAHKSPEEAFAEYYSFYSQHRKRIDSFLEDENLKHVSVASSLKFDDSKKYFREHQNSIDSGTSQSMRAHLIDKKRDVSDHIRVAVIDPYYDNLETTKQSNVLPAHIAYNKRDGVANKKEPQPVFSVFDYNTGVRDIVADSPDAGIHYSNKYLRRLSPTFSMSKECFNLLTEKGYNYHEIRAFALQQVGEQKIPNVFSSSKEKGALRVEGLKYRGQVVSNDVIRGSKVIFQQMKHIWESDELKKALSELFLDNDMEKGEEFNELKFKDTLTEALKSFTDVIKNTLSRPSKDGRKYYADVVLRNEKGEILLLQRSYQDDFMPGKWWLPGGKIDPGEDPITAAERELFEETGIDMKGKLTFLVKREKSDCTIHYFEAFLDKPFVSILDVEEHMRLQWVAFDDLAGCDLLDTPESLLTLPTTILFEVESSSITNMTYDRLFRKSKMVSCLFNMGEIDTQRYLELKKSLKEDFNSITEGFNKGEIDENEYFLSRKLVG